MHDILMKVAANVITILLLAGLAAFAIWWTNRK